MPLATMGRVLGPQPPPEWTSRPGFTLAKGLGDNSVCSCIIGSTAYTVILPSGRNAHVPQDAARPGGRGPSSPDKPNGPL
eukprot:7305509-Alexandrium_andersonii.AAC.1